MNTVFLVATVCLSLSNNQSCDSSQVHVINSFPNMAECFEPLIEQNNKLPDYLKPSVNYTCELQD